MSLIFANIKEEDILCRNEIDSLADRFPGKFNRYYVLNEPPAGWTMGTGYVSQEHIKANLPAPGMSLYLLLSCCCCFLRCCCCFLLSLSSPAYCVCSSRRSRGLIDILCRTGHVDLPVRAAADGRRHGEASRSPWVHQGYDFQVLKTAISTPPAARRRCGALVLCGVC